MKRKGMLNRIACMVALIVALLSCLAINVVGAKYSSLINGDVLVPAANFIVNIKYENGQDNLHLTPSLNGSFAAVEFTISNKDQTDISEVNQNFAIGLLVDVETVISFSQMQGSDFSLKPFAPRQGVQKHTL